MALDFVADYTATSFSKRPGHALDTAAQGAVRVQRRGEVFILLRAHHLDEIIREAGDPRPKTLEDMLRGYDASEVKAGMAGWLADTPAGKEAL